jgi:hypothetical protein
MSAETDRNPPFRWVQNRKGGRMLLADKICVKTGVASRCGIGWATVALFAVSRIHFGDGIKPIVGCILALIAGLIVVAAVPWISIGFLD